MARLTPRVFKYKLWARVNLFLKFTQFSKEQNCRKNAAFERMQLSGKLSFWRRKILPTSNTWPFRMVKNGQKLSIRYKNGDYGQKRFIRSKTEEEKKIKNSQQRSTTVNSSQYGQKWSKRIKNSQIIQKLSKQSKTVNNGQKWSEMVHNA